jgi:hypothetical protein
MIEHWILRDLSRFRRALFFAALFADFMAGLCREHLNTLLRHPRATAVPLSREEPRILRGVSKDGRGRCRLLPILRGSPLRGERLRMTVEIFSFINIKFFDSLSPPPKPRLS